MRLIKQSLLNQLINTLNCAEINTVLPIIRDLTKSYYFYDDAIIYLMNNINLLNFSNYADEKKFIILDCFNISENFNNIAMFKEVLNCFKNDLYKHRVLNKKMNETKLIFLDIYKCIECFHDELDKILVLEKMLLRDSEIKEKNIYYSETGCFVVETIINLQNIPTVMKMFKKKFYILSKIINHITKLIKREDIKDLLLKSKFDAITEENITKIITELDRPKYVKLFLTKFPSYDANKFITNNNE